MLNYKTKLITWGKNKVFHQTHHHQRILGLSFTSLSGHLDIVYGPLQAQLQKAPLDDTMRDQEGLCYRNDIHSCYSLTTYLESKGGIFGLRSTFLDCYPGPYPSFEATVN